MPDKRGTFYEDLAREASKTLVETRFNIAFRQTLDKYKRGFLTGAKNGYTYGYIVLDDVKRDIREKLDKLSSKQLSPAAIRKIRLPFEPFDDDMILDLIVKYATQVWGLEARVGTKNSYRYVRVTWPLELNMLNLDKTK